MSVAAALDEAKATEAVAGFDPTKAAPMRKKSDIASSSSDL